MPEGVIDGAAQNQPAGGEQQGGTPTGQPQGQQGQQQQGQQGQQGAQRQDPAPGQNGGQSAQDRGILADLQRERRARQELENRLRAAEGQFAEAQRRVAALAGVHQPNEEEAQIEQIRAQFARVFPGLARLTDDQIESLLEQVNTSQSLQQTVAHHWENHGRTMLDALSGEVSRSIGGDLTERQARALARAYVAEAEANPEFLRRHEAGDKKLIEEFAKQWLEDWYEPARRSVTAQSVNQGRRVPAGRDRNVQSRPPQAINFKDPKAVEDAMVESFKRHGGQFGE